MPYQTKKQLRDKIDRLEARLISERETSRLMRKFDLQSLYKQTYPDYTSVIDAVAEVLGIGGPTPEDRRNEVCRLFTATNELNKQTDARDDLNALIKAAFK